MAEVKAADSHNNQHDLPRATVSLVHDDTPRYRQASQLPADSGDVTTVVDKVSGQCCCCPLVLTQLHGQQERRCTCCIRQAHNVHVPPPIEPLAGLQIQQQSLPTPWRGVQVDKPTASVGHNTTVSAVSLLTGLLEMKYCVRPISCMSSCFFVHYFSSYKVTLIQYPPLHTMWVCTRSNTVCRQKLRKHKQ